MKRTLYPLLCASVIFASLPATARENDCGRTCFKEVLCEIKHEVEEIKEGLSKCGKVTPIYQADLPFEIIDSGYYCLAEDVSLDLNAVSAGIVGASVIYINATNVDLNLNEHTINIAGSGQAIATIGTSSHVNIHNGTIFGDGGVSFQNGIAVNTSDVTVSDINIQNSGCSNGIFGEIYYGGIVAIGAYYASPNAESYEWVAASGIVIERCQLTNNGIGLNLQIPINGATIRDCTLDGSTLFGIAAPSRSLYSNNIVIENCAIINSGLHGIYTTFQNNNWTIRNCQINNSGVTGMLFAGFQGLKIQDCQVYDCGGDGIVGGIRALHNVEVSGCQVFNAAGAAFRMFNVENLTVRDCEFTSYTPTPTPLVQIQDIYNGTIQGCKMNSLSDTSDGFVITNCLGLTVQDCGVNVVNTTTDNAGPIAINLKGGSANVLLQNCNVSGAPSIGINVGTDLFGLSNRGIIIDRCSVQGARARGISLEGAVNSVVYDSNVFSTTQDGVVLDNCQQCVLRNNTVINNGGFGINNLGTSIESQIYHNFANNNGTDYAGVPLPTSYGALTDGTSWFVNVQS